MHLLVDNNCLYTAIISMYQFTYTMGGKSFDPLLLLYVCPLTKKWSVYNFNGRFIWTERDRITTTKIQKNLLNFFYKLICILMSEISIWSPINQEDFWLPGVFYTGEKLRLEHSLKEISACCLYKRHLSTEAINQTPNSPPWPRPKSCTWMSGIRL